MYVIIIYIRYRQGRGVGVLVLFTGGWFTVHSGVLRLSAVAISSDVVPVHCVPVGLSNIKEQGLSRM